MGHSTTSPLLAARVDERGAIAQLEASIVAGRPQEALRIAPSLLSAYPESGDLYHLLGVALAALGQLDDALAAYSVAIQFRPERADILSNCAVTLKQAGRPVKALELLDKAIAKDAGLADAHYNRANILADLRSLEDAVTSYDRAIAARPDHAQAWNNRSVSLFQLGRVAEALSSADRAIELAPNDANAHYNRALALRKHGQLDLAIDAYQTAVRLQPEFTRARVGKMFLDACMCRWEDREGDLARGPTGLTGAAIDPFPLLALEDRPDRHRTRAERWVKANWEHIERTPIPHQNGGAKLKIGYFSADFHDHATMHLMGRLFALHDRTKFEIHGFSFGPPSNDPFRIAATDGMDAFHEVRHMNDAAAAALARQQGIDIAIDLKGHTQGARTGIFAHGAAPVQAAYLGYPGTTGAGFIDFLIADEIVIPPAQRHHYSERIVFLPDNYLATDNSRIVAEENGGRAAHGLPESGFVFCSFNNSYKISAAEFDCWMRLLDAVDGSVLWLLRDNEWAPENLRIEAAKRGIDPMRLIFAPRTTSHAHLSRHGLADLCLDSFNCNAHTTAVDSLWAGVPLLTTGGEGFAARVAESLLRAIELPGLVAEDRADYERRALMLARSPEKLAELRDCLHRKRYTAALFDTERKARHLDAAFLLMHEAHALGTTEDIRVSA